MENNTITEKNSKNIGLVVLAVISIAGGILIPLVGYITGIIAIVMSLKNKAYKENKRVKTALILAIVGIAVSLASHIYGVIVLLNSI